MGKRSLAERTAVQEGMIRRLYRGSVATCDERSAVPALIDEYVHLCDSIFAAMGRRFTQEQLVDVRAVLEGQLAQAYAASPRSMITISFNAPSASC